MPQAAYPTGADLESYLLTLGIYPAEMPREELAALDLPGKAAAAATEWEVRTGWLPFLANGSDATRLYDPPWGSRVLSLGGGIISVSEINSGGSILVESDTYWLEPSAAPYVNRPYEAIVFAGFAHAGARRSIMITGRWGYATTVPDDVWQALLVRGAALCAPQMSLVLGGGAETVRVLSSEVRYPSAASGGPLASQAKGWQSAFDAAVNRYKRIEVI